MPLTPLLPALSARHRVAVEMAAPWRSRREHRGPSGPPHSFSALLRKYGLSAPLEMRLVSSPLKHM
jgi:hypothetical protein